MYHKSVIFSESVYLSCFWYSKTSCNVVLDCTGNKTVDHNHHKTKSYQHASDRKPKNIKHIILPISAICLS